jgi:spore maturation protein CgeB
LEERAPGFLAALEGHATLPDPSVLLGEIAASEKRLSYAASLGQLGLVVWGDAGWEHVRQFGVDYRGPALHRTELTLIYNASAINVDIGRIFQSDIVTMRTFDILACGGFLLVEHADELADLFDVGTELESYRTFAELKDKITYYLAHEDEARAIAARGQAAVRERHTIAQRLEAMLGEMSARAA